MRVKIVSVLVLLLLVWSSVFYLESGGIKINADIPSDKMTAKGLIEVTKPYVDKYWGDRNYYVGSISMTLDKNFEGIVEICYKDDRKNRNGVPNIITVKLDTKERKILRIVNEDRDTKNEPEIINIEEWNLDSSDIIDIAKNTFRDLDDFGATFVYISGNKLFSDGKEKWSINIYNEESKKAYHLEIDPYTGDIYRQELK